MVLVSGEICAGTIDSWLLFRLTGEQRIEAGKATRTQLMNLATLDWDDRLLDLFGVPRVALPVIAASTTPSANVQSARMYHEQGLRQPEIAERTSPSRGYPGSSRRRSTSAWCAPSWCHHPGCTLTSKTGFATDTS
jgi:glycerol kinase